MTTRRLVLRRFLKSDGEGLYDYLSDPEVVKLSLIHISEPTRRS